MMDIQDAMRAIYRLNEAADCLCDLIAHPDRADPADVAIVTSAVGSRIHTMRRDDFRPVAAAMLRIREQIYGGVGQWRPNPPGAVVEVPIKLEQAAEPDAPESDQDRGG
jgi:hypothetical protein